VKFGAGRGVVRARRSCAKRASRAANYRYWDLLKNWHYLHTIQNVYRLSIQFIAYSDSRAVSTKW